MYSKDNNFIENINNLYHDYKEDILKVNLGEDICKELSEKDKESFFKYQEFLYNYMKDLNDFSNKGNKIDNRGLLIYHGLGSGKTTSGIIISESCREYKLNEEEEHYKTKENYKRKVILMIPANLFFDPWVKEISSKCYSNCIIRDDINKILNDNKDKMSENKLKEMIINKLKEHDFYVINYNAFTLKGGYKDKLLEIPNRKETGDKYTNKYSESINPFDDSVVVIDESHNLINMITNKIKNGEEVELYKDLFYADNARMILLSGTPIINDIFEISITSNIIRGYIDNKIKFEDNYKEFEEKFIDLENTNIKNKNMLRRRLNGIISYNKGITENVFAKEINEKIYVPFSIEQENGYNIAEKLSKLEKDDYKDDRKVGLFQRKASNVVFPNYIFDKKALSMKKLKKKGENIEEEFINNKNNLLDTTITKELEKKIIKLLDNDEQPLNINNDLYKISKKIYLIIKKIKESNGPVLVYSNFEGLYGIKLMEEALKQNGFKNYNSNNKETESYMKWTGKDRNIKNKNIFNSIENKNGKLIKVFLMTSSGKEGINLIGIRQVHIMEPWWNNTLIKQVIGRAIRICSHNHIEEEDFIDLRFKEELRIVNNRIVNVFQYYGFLDLRNKNTDKTIIKEEMRRRSIDYNIKIVADKKEILEKQLLEILKEIAIDCNINHERNNEDIICYIDNINKDYFESWNVKDDEIRIVKKQYEKIKIENKLYIKDQFRNIYKINENISTIDFNNIEENIIKIGKLNNGMIEYDNNYYKNEKYQIVKKKKVIKNYLKKICETSKIDINQDVDYYGLYDKNLILTLKTFNNVNVYTNDKEKYEKIEKLDNNFSIKKENEKLENKVLIINKQENLEKMVNELKEPEKIIVCNVNINDVTELFLFNNSKYYEKDNCLIISNKKPKNDFYKMIHNLDMNIENKIKIVKDLEKINISTEEKLLKYLKDEKELNDIFSILKVKLNIKDDTFFDIRNFNECVKMLLKDIKKSKEYKEIPRKYNKSKMKKNEICKTIQDINS